MKKAKFNTAPLPFQGQKRRFVKDISNIIRNIPTDTVYIDLFGGSGLLSHTVKSVHPDAQVVYNDFDGYKERIENIPKTNKLLADIREILKDYPREKLISQDVRSKIISRIESEEGFVDYITLSASILFSMKYATCIEDLKKEAFHNNIRKSDYNAEGYLDGLSIVRYDYKELFKKYQDTDVILLVDPPYLSTDCGTYSNYWKLADYLGLLEILDNHRFFYFTSSKSTLIELCEYIENRTGTGNPFKGAQKSEVNVQMNKSSGYTDIMLYKV